ncbi:heavy metal-binding domain-containing protein [Adhaeribacter soli]|uniref:Heavy metal binding domain-containing protein n=1 Tax=Adhaeribacter soli TaxID=2607655 RepID=A0A5N1J0Q2_9BACT|nr:heavy metal-binding domain-containing protein [Adhaeribacter soli]KAA9340064.1 hypothetical protein F0P94_06865 [Adhaeribacter soli]
MKIKNIAAALFLAASLAGFTGCGQQTAKEETTETTEKAKITDKAYICPMYCENSASDQPGKCPVCEMDLEKNPDYVAPASASADTTGAVADTAAAN